MAEDLTELAKQYVSLTAQLEEVRNAMRAVLANGLGGDPEPPANPTRAGKRPGKTTKTTAQSHRAKHLRRDEVIQEAKRADEQVIALLRNEPMRLAKLAEATGQKQTTLSNRLKRLAGRGAIERRGDGWAATSGP
jgi:predicted Rossmann fold nucleotide-binding protein DprA/Smf involved in DNA uptake